LRLARTGAPQLACLQLVLGSRIFRASGRNRQIRKLAVTAAVSVDTGAGRSLGYPRGNGDVVGVYFGAIGRARYSCGVRSSEVMVVILVTSQRPLVRFMNNRYDRYFSEGMFLVSGLVEDVLV